MSVARASPYPAKPPSTGGPTRATGNAADPSELAALERPLVIGLFSNMPKSNAVFVPAN